MSRLRRVSLGEGQPAAALHPTMQNAPLVGPV
jgi:hypothetical protein